MEIWKSINGYEGMYQVSNIGRVKSLERVIVRSNGIVLPLKERILKPALDGRGYLQVNLSKYGKLKVIKVHQLVAMSFLGHIPNGHKIVCDHIDNNPLNNNVENLQLITNRKNSSKDQKGGTSQCIGVSLYKPLNKWQAGIWIKGKQKNLGYFTNEVDAAKEYQTALKLITKK